MSYPIETIYVHTYEDSKKIYICPDCNVEMCRFDKTHSPLSRCYHSVCPKCGLDYCDYYQRYWGQRPKNSNAVKRVEEK
jgi:peptide subunit release factor 1 (eRF1)